MKKKLFAALAAALMLGSTMAAPVSAAETYKKGDVNMDGEITVADAQMILREYANHIVVGRNPEFTPEQEKLAAVLGLTHPYPFSSRESTPYSLDDAQCILMFATAKTAGLDVEPVSFYEEFRRNME